MNVGFCLIGPNCKKRTLVHTILYLQNGAPNPPGPNVNRDVYVFTLQDHPLCSVQAQVFWRACSCWSTGHFPGLTLDFWHSAVLCRLASWWALVFFLIGLAWVCSCVFPCYLGCCGFTQCFVCFGCLPVQGQ